MAKFQKDIYDLLLDISQHLWDEFQKRSKENNIDFDRAEGILFIGKTFGQISSGLVLMEKLRQTDPEQRLSEEEFQADGIKWMQKTLDFMRITDDLIEKKNSQRTISQTFEMDESLN